jgi:hypothetical protein
MVAIKPATEKTMLKCRGLNRYGNPALRPEGTAEEASNVVCDAPDTYSPRRGFDRLAGTLPGSATVRDIIAYNGEILVYASDGKLYLYDDTVGHEAFTVFNARAGVNYSDTSDYVLPIEANGNLYITSNLGVVKLEGTTPASNYVVKAGMTAGLSGTAATTGSAGFLGYSVAVTVTTVAGATLTLSSVAGISVGDTYYEGDVLNERIDAIDSGASTITLASNRGWSAGTGAVKKGGPSAAYRVVFGIKDANDNLVIGAPSNPILVTNGDAGNRNVELIFDLPAEITPSHIYRVYRTNTCATTAVGDVMRLVYEAQVTSDNVTDKHIHYTDSSPDSMIASALELYTNTNQGGISLAKKEPPKCKDMAFFQNSMFYANLTYKHTYSFQLLATGTDAGGTVLISTDTVVIAGQTYTAGANESGTTFKLTTGGSPAVDVRLTAESLVRVINQNAANTTVYAYYDSGLTDLPGKIRIEERNYGGSTFTVQCAASGSAFNPVISTAQNSKVETAPNRVAWSRYQEPEAVPAFQYADIGSKQTSILRIIPLRESLFILTDRGIYILTGQDTNSFRVSPSDLTVSLLAPLSAVALNNTIFCLTDQGVCRIDEKGVALISLDFEDDVKSWMGASLTNLKALARGCKYETDRKYILAVPTVSTDTYATEFWVFNSTNGAWTTWDRTATALLVNPANDRLYLAPGGASQLSRERKAYNFLDFCDEPISVTPTAVTANVVTLTSTVGIEVGDVYSESTTAFSTISAIDTLTNKITLDADLSWQSSGTFEVWPAYTSTVTWNPIVDGGAAHLKQFSEAAVLTAYSFSDGQLGFRTDQGQDWEYVDLPGTTSSDLWGLFAWGEVPWGGEAGMLRSHRTYVPRAKQRSSGLYVRFTIDSALSDWELTGIEITARSCAKRSGR